MAEHLPVTVEVDANDLREWAGRHADAGHHGVAHVLYQAAEGVESITEQHDREVKAEALREWIAEWPTTPSDGTFLADVARDGLARADRLTAELDA